MSDGRSQGLGTYLASGELNRAIKQKLMINDDHEYRSVIQNEAQKVIKAHRETAPFPEPAFACLKR